MSSPSATEILTRGEHRLLVGSARPSAVDGRTRELLDPATGAALGHASESGAEDIDRAVRTAREAFEHGSWRRLAPAARGQLIGRLAELIDDARETFAALEVANAGKRVADARGYDVARAVEHFEYFAGWPGKLAGETIPVGERHLVYSLREPVGVVGLIVPWNFPLMIAAWKVAPALAAGCTLVLKPSPETPLSALLLAELALEAGISAGCPERRARRHRGRRRARGARRRRQGLVHGLDRDGPRDRAGERGQPEAPVARARRQEPADRVRRRRPRDAAGAAIRAGFFHAGQACVAGSRLLVEQPVFEEFVATVARRAEALQVGPGSDPATDMGPLISARQLARVRGYVEAGTAAGAGVATGGGTLGGNFLEPTILTTSDDEAAIVREEIFGPVVVAQAFTNEQEVVVRANATIYGLTSGVFTRDVARAHRMARELRAGTVWINTYMVGDSAVPTGGVKQSGYGRDRGRRALEGYLEEKMVWVGTPDA